MSIVNEIPGAGTPIGLKDRNGVDVCLGDVLRFDPAEWYRSSRWTARLHGVEPEPEIDPVFVVYLERGEVHMLGAPGDIESWCDVIRRWDDQPDDQAAEIERDICNGGKP